MAGNEENKINMKHAKRSVLNRSVRLLVLAVIFFVVIAGGVIAFAPRLAGTSVGLAIINRAINTAPHTKVEIRDLDLHWSGTQRIPKIHIDQNDGAVTADLSVALTGSLWAWGVSGSRDFGTVVVDGQIDIDEAKLNAASSSTGSVTTNIRGTKSITANVSLPLQLAGEVQFKDVGISYHPDTSISSVDAVLGSGPVEVNHLTGMAGFLVNGQGGEASWKFSADTTVAGAPGHIQSTGKITDFVDGITGLVDADNAKYEINLNSTAVPIPIIDALADGTGRLTTLFGGKADIRANMVGSLKSGGLAEVSIKSPSASVRFTANLTNDEFVIKKGSTAHFTFAKGALVSFADDEAMRTRLASSNGTLDFNIHQLQIPLRADRSINYDGISIKADLNAALASIELSGEASAGPYDSLALSNFTTTIQSENITDNIAVTINSKIVLSNNETGVSSIIPLDGKISLHQAVSKAGVFAPSNQTVSAAFTAKHVNSTLVDEAAGLDHWVRDTAGIVIDRVHLTLNPGETGEDPMRIIIAADSKQARLRFKIRLDDEHGVTLLANEGDEPQIDLTIGDDLGKRIAKMLVTTDAGSAGVEAITIHPPRRMTIAVNEFNLPVQAPMSQLSDMDAIKAAIRSISVDANINMRGGKFTFPASYLALDVIQADTDTITLDSVTTNISTNKLSDEIGIDLHSTGKINSENDKPFALRIPLHITSPLNPSARRSSAEVFIDQFLGSTIHTKLAVAEGKSECNITASGEINLTPALAKRFLTEEGGILLDENCTVKFALEPINLRRLTDGGGGNDKQPGAIDWDGLTQSAAVGAHIEVDGLEVRGVSDFQHAVGVKYVIIDARWPAGVNGIPQELKAKGAIYDTAKNIKIFTFNALRDNSKIGGSSPTNFLRLDLREVNTTALESLLGYEPGTLSDLTGDGMGGEVTIEADLNTLMDLTKGRPNERTLHIVGKFPRFTADVSGRMNENADRIVLEPGGVIRFNINKTTAERMLARLYETAEAGKSEKTTTNHIVVKDDIHASLTIREASIRTNAFAGESADGGLTPDAIALDAELALSPFMLQAAQGEQVFDQFTMRDVRVAINSKDGDDSIGFDVSALIRNRAESPAIFRELVLGVNDEPDENNKPANDVGNLVNMLLGKTEESGNSRPAGNEGVVNQNDGNGNGTGTVTKTPAEVNPDGDIRITGTVTGILSATGDSAQGESWIIRNLSGKINHLPVPFLDVLADSSGTLTAALGSSLSADIEAREFGPGRGAIALMLMSDSGRLQIRSAQYLADGTIQVGTDSTSAAQPTTGGENISEPPMFASFDLTPDMTHTILEKVSPMFYDIRKKNGPITLSAQYLRLPTDGDLSKIDADLVLDLGQIDMSSGGFFGDLLGTAKKKVGDSTTATLKPIPIHIRKGIVAYEKFEIQADTFKVTTGGKINLLTKELDLTAAVPLIGWQSTFGKLTGALNGPVTDWNIPFYLVIRGTIDNPKIKPDPKGAQRVADQLFKKTIDDTVGNIFNQLLNKNKKNNKKKKKKKNGGGG